MRTRSVRPGGTPPKCVFAHFLHRQKVGRRRREGIRTGIIAQTWHRVLAGEATCPSERKVKSVAEAVGFSRRKGLARREEERRQLMEGMRQTRDQLNYAYAQFNTYSDPDLVDACVYEINALQSRYSYFVRQMKQLDAAREEAV